MRSGAPVMGQHKPLQPRNANEGRSTNEASYSSCYKGGRAEMKHHKHPGDDGNWGEIKRPKIESQGKEKSTQDEGMQKSNWDEYVF